MLIGSDTHLVHRPLFPYDESFAKCSASQAFDECRYEEIFIDLFNEDCGLVEPVQVALERLVLSLAQVKQVAQANLFVFVGRELLDESAR